MSMRIDHDEADFERLDIATIPDPKPARACVTVTELGKNAKV